MGGARRRSGTPRTGATGAFPGGPLRRPYVDADAERVGPPGDRRRWRSGMILAQSKPVQLVLPGGADGRLESALRIGGAIAALALTLALAVLLLRVRNRRYDPAESAFVKLARSGGLSRRERRAIRALARDA